MTYKLSQQLISLELEIAISGFLPVFTEWWKLHGPSELSAGESERIIPPRAPPPRSYLCIPTDAAWNPQGRNVESSSKAPLHRPTMYKLWQSPTLCL